MIAIKQAKFKPPSNKTQENQIKNTTSAAAILASTGNSSNTPAANHQINNSNDVDRPKQQALVKSTCNDQRNNSQTNQHQSNETRSETNNIDGAISASATAAKLSQAPSPPSPLSPSSARTPSPSVLSSTSSGVTVPAAATLARKARLLTAATSTEEPSTSSLITASSRIQQRQQKFLAAAAKSATSPQYHSNQSLMLAKQATRHKTPLVPLCANGDMSKLDEADPNARSTVRTPAYNKRYHVSMSIINGSCCRRDVDCCPLAQHQPALINCDNSAKLGPAPMINSALCPTMEKVSPAVKNTHDVKNIADPNVDSHCCLSQRGCGKQTMPQQAPSKAGDASTGLVRTKVLSMATMISGASGVGIGKIKGGANKGSIETLSDNKQPRANDDCRPMMSRASNATDVTSTESSGVASLTTVNVGNINRQVARLTCDDDASYNIRELHQGVRKAGENKDTDDNINIKHTTKHNNHNYYHHYYNHNYLNYHHHQQPQQHQHHQNQPNYFHLKYQPAQQQSAQFHQSTQPHHHQQHIMAHYKFHNDCQSSVLTYEQVDRLDSVMNQVVPIYGRGNSPTLYVKLKELIRLVKYKLQHEHSIEIRDVRLNGGAASYVLSPENSQYNDLDLVFGTDLSDEDRFDVIRDVVLECLMEFYPGRHQAQHEDQSTAEDAIDTSKISSGDNSDADHKNGSNLTDSVVDDDLEDLSGQSLRSERSSSFESDNLNVTTTELDEDSSEDEDNIIVRIDNEMDETTIDANQNQQDKQTKICKTSGETISMKQIDTKELPVQSTISATKCRGARDVSGNPLAEYNSGNHLNVSLQGVHYQYNQMPPNNCAVKEAYVHKMVKVNDDDRWSLISLGVQQSETSNFNQQQHQQHADTAQINQNDSCVVVGHGSQSAPNGLICCEASATPYAQENSKHFSKHQKQFPNSIELKFVDRMRRKFEFSVDSFQIILDSLIQFYDFAPQSTITIQRNGQGMHPASTMINPKNLVSQAPCAQCDRAHRVLFERNVGDHGLVCSNQESAKSVRLTNCKYQEDGHQNVSEAMSATRSFYELPLEPVNLLSNSSVASSSGCSSSSSVVSSSSSSLSCDDDQEDLYCDQDRSPSSSVSTSSLLSSTGTSILSSTSTAIMDCNAIGTKSQQSKHPKKTTVNPNESKNQQQQQQHSRASVGKRLDGQTSGVISNGCGLCHEKKMHESNSVEDKLHVRSYSNLYEFGTSKISSCAVISENFYPTVIGRSEYGNFKEALYHLEKKLIATRSPEEIRGGGLLKYCNLLVKSYKPTNVYQIRTLERYMCSRFFIDFSDLNQQRAKLESYLANHFSDDPMQKFDYLTILHNVVQRSTVCLMNHELRLTLGMIRELAYNLNEQQAKQHQHYVAQ